MKRFKKYLSLILMVIFTLSMSMAAFAQGTITVADPQDGATYTAYKIFDVVKDNEDVLTYTIKHAPHAAGYEDEINDWFDVVKDFPGLEFELLTTNPSDPYASPVVDADGNYTYIVTKQTGFSAADFAEKLLYTLENAGSAFNPGTGYTGNPDIDVYEPGYYMVTTTIVDENNNEELLDKAALTTVTDGDTVIIQDKNDMPFEKTVNQLNEMDVQVGQRVQYEITTKVPSTKDEDNNNYDNFEFVISDTMGKGLTFLHNVRVFIEVGQGSGDYYKEMVPGYLYAENNNYIDDYYYAEFVKVEPGNGDLIEVPMQELVNSELDTTQDQIKYAEDGFKLCLDMLSRQDLVNKKIYVVYDAEINSEAVVRISENKAVLEYGHDDDITVKDDSTKVYTSRILIDKFEAGSTANSQKLSGAEFILRRAIPTGADDENVYHYEYYTWVKEYDYTTTPETLVREYVKWVSADEIMAIIAAMPYQDQPEMNNEEAILKLAADEGIITKVVTDDNGAALFDGLANYTNYEVIEIKAPAGYTKLAAPIPVVINGEDATTVGLSAIQVTEILTEVLNVANTPGSLIPSTGGMGTTLFYIVGAIMVFGAVVVLVTRRRMSE